MDVLAQELPEQQFNTWIKPLVVQSSNDLSKVTLFIANRFKLDWIRAQYANRITVLLEKMYGQPIQLELALTPRENVTKVSAAISNPEFGVPSEAIDMAYDGGPAGLKTRLNTALTFDTLVEGTANRMARAAALHVSGTPGQLYNPLFIYGGVGLGKTHLMHAIGNRLLLDRPNAKVLYIHAEQFVTDVVKAYQRKTFDEFKERYHSLDLLLIDDVQFFANKERTQEEFFNAFEALLARKSHLVMTSDTYPKGLTDIHERLVSRFDSGLTVAIEPPELEMRVAILISKPKLKAPRCPKKWPFSSPKTCAPTCASWKARCAKSWLIPASTKKTSRLPWPVKHCATCCRSRTARFRLKTSKKRSPTTTKSKSPTCIPKSAPPALRGHARLRCIWPKS